MDGSYKDLIVWQKSVSLVKLVYGLSASFPSEEKFGIISQMRRCAISIPSNIAEGQARRTTPDYVRFVSIAQGSLAELETQLIISVELGYCELETKHNIFALATEVRKMLNALRRSLMEKMDREKGKAS